MSATTTTKCDGVGCDATRTKYDSAWGTVDGNDACPSCLARAVRALVSPTEEELTEQDRVEQEELLRKRLKDAEESLKVAQSDRAEFLSVNDALNEAKRRNAAFEDLVRALQGDVQKANDRAKDLDHALGKERADARAIAADRDAWRQVAVELLEMLGKKARRRYAERIAEIERVIETGTTAITSFPTFDKNDALIEARRRAQAEMKAMRDVTGPSFLERHSGEGHG